MEICAATGGALRGDSDGGRIEAARQKYSHRDVAAQSESHAVHEGLTHGFEGRRSAIELALLVWRAPIAVHGRGEAIRAPQVEPRAAAGAQCLDAREECLLLGVDL